MDKDRYIGRLLDSRYEILEVIGTGGMAVVYKARCHRLNRLVAIKILKDEYTQDEEFRRRFHAESHAVAMLSHPNIVSIYDVSTSDDADYIVMELIDGITLKQYMERKGVLNWKETLHFAIQICKALEHAHSRGIIHRDIKPHNVMVLKNGSVKVTDFGIARVMSQSNTLTKEALGSVHYISPEQAKGGRVSNCSDLYSLGVVMYEMMAGRPPYDGETPVSVAIQHISGKAPMPSTLNPNIPGGLEQIIMKAMAHEPADRYATAGAMLCDMDEFRKNPTILFDYNNPDVDIDAALRMSEEARKQRETPTTPTAADRAVARKTPQKPRAEKPAAPKPVKKPHHQEEIIEDERDRSSKVATIAILVCAVAAIIAIVILAGSLMDSNELITVPNLVGLYEEDLASRADRYDLEFRVGERVNSDKYEKGQIMHQTPVAHTQIAKGGKVTVTVSLGPATSTTKTMKDFVNKDENVARSYLTGTLGIAEDRIQVITESSTVVEAGKIIRTEPVEGAIIAEDQDIVLYISTGPDVIMETVPYVENLSVDSAYIILRAAGFKNITTEPVNSSKEKDTVIQQSVPANHKVDVNTTIVLKISLGPNASTGESVLPTIPEPDPDLKFQVITVEIPEDADFLEKYVVSIWYEDQMIDEQEVMEGAKSIQFEVSGKGVMEFTVYFNGRDGQQIEVDFDA